MIQRITEMINTGRHMHGQESLSLYELWTNGVDIADTIFVAKDVFKAYYETGRLPDEYIDQILAEMNTGEFLACEQLFIRHSLSKDFNGLRNNIRASKTVTDIKNAIERIYRSWFDDMARASRITNSIGDADGFPSLLIQLFLDEIQSLTTRISASGEATNEINYQTNVHNTLEACDATSSAWLASIETIMHRPTKVYFIDRGSRRICAVRQQAITTAGHLRALSEYYHSGSISIVDYLSQIDPSMLLTPTGYKYDDSRGDTVTVHGLPAAPGSVLGRVVFRTSNIEQLIGNYRLIFAVTETSPEDFHIITHCSGAIGVRGGMTSHLAVISRGVSIPAVISSELKIDDAQKTLVGKGKEFGELASVMVDGSLGLISFTDQPAFDANYALDSRMSSHINEIYQLIKSLGIDILAQLPMDAQLHIAKLKNRLSKVGYTQW